MIIGNLIESIQVSFVYFIECETEIEGQSR